MAAAPSPSVPACGDLPAAVSAFADAFVDFAVSGIFFPTSSSSAAAAAAKSSPPPAPTAPTTFLPSPSRLVAIGDLHGDLPKSLSALRLAGLVPASTGPDSPSAATSWAAGPTLAVQLGDILDRGGDELRLLYLLRRLALSAEARGGALLPILGNHEVMNVSGDFRFATPQGLQEFSAWAGWYRAGLAIKRRCGEHLDPQPRNPPRLRPAAARSSPALAPPLPPSSPASTNAALPAAQGEGEERKPIRTPADGVLQRLLWSSSPSSTSAWWRSASGPVDSSSLDTAAASRSLLSSVWWHPKGGWALASASSTTAAAAQSPPFSSLLCFLRGWPPPPLVRRRLLLRPDAFEERGDVFLHPLSPPNAKCIA